MSIIEESITIILDIVLVYVAAIKHPSAQFQSGMEQHQVTDLLVTKLQQYSGIIKIQVRTNHFTSFPPLPPSLPPSLSPSLSPILPLPPRHQL